MRTLSFDLCEKFIGDTSQEEMNDNRQKREFLKKVLKLIIVKELTPRQRQMCLMYFFEQKNMPTIANELGLNKSTVSRTIAAALRNIGDRIKYYRLR